MIAFGTSHFSSSSLNGSNKFPYVLNLLESFLVQFLILFLNLQIQMDENYSGNLFYNIKLQINKINEIKNYVLPKSKRGLEYYYDNHVLKPIVYGSVLRAEVVGDDFHPYTVEIKYMVI